MKKIMVVIAATGLLLGFVYTCSPYSKTQMGETLRFQYPEVNSIQDTVTLQGSVFAAELQRLYPRGSSRVLEIYVSEGQQVTAGQCLMKLEQTEPATGEQVASALAMTELKDAILSGDLTAAEQILNTVNTNIPLQINNCEVYYLYSNDEAIVMNISANIGEIASSLLPCMELYSPESLQIEAIAGEDVIGLLEQNMDCYVSVPAFGVNDLPGSLSVISPYAKQTTRLTGQTTYDTVVEIKLQEPASLKPGYRAAAKVVVSLRENALLLPYEAVGQDDTGQEYVLKLQGRRVIKQVVETGSELESQVEIKQGLSRQDVVLLQPDLQWEGALIHLASH